MIVPDVLKALELPPGTPVNQRIPKKTLVENGAPTAADRRRINEGIEELYWLAVIKPNNTGIPDYRDREREYSEIAILSMTLRSGAKMGRLAELVHRAIPYPVLLIIAHDDCVTLSLAHKRWAKNEVGKVVVEGQLVEMVLDSQQTTEVETIFLKELSITHQRHNNLFTLYQGWIDTIHALQIARLTGIFVQAKTSEQAVARQHALQECERLQAQIAVLRRDATKEKQIARQVELNLEIKRMRGQLAAAKEQLGGGDYL